MKNLFRLPSVNEDEDHFVQPHNLDQLSAVAKELLLDKHLAVSKVRPFFWSMVETYVDRFQIYPFDIVKAMLSYLETCDFPEEQTRELVDMLEQGYLQQHGKALRENKSLESVVPAAESPVQIAPQLSDSGSLDDELRELRACLKYAAMVGEREAQD